MNSAKLHLHVRRFWAATVKLGLVLLVAAMFYSGAQSWESIVATKWRQATTTSEETWAEDYVVFLAAGHLVAEGRGSELYDLQAIKATEAKVLGRQLNTPAGDGVLPYFNPPYFAAVLAPLASLNAGTFAAVLFVLVLASILASTYGLVRLFQPNNVAEIVIISVWFLSLGSVTFLAWQSQLSMLPLLAWLIYIWSIRQERPMTAGIALSLGLIKPQLVLAPVLFNLWQWRPTFLKGFFVVAFGLGIASLVVGGIGVVVSYPRLLFESTTWERANGIILENMYGWSGFYARTLGGTGLLHSLLTMSSIVATIALVVLVLRRNRDMGSHAFLPISGTLMLATLLISLHFYRQDMTLVALAVIVGALHSRETQGNLGYWPLAAVLVWFTQHYGPDLLFDHDINVQTPTVLILFLLFVKVGMSLPTQSNRTAPKALSPSAASAKSQIIPSPSAM